MTSDAQEARKAPGGRVVILGGGLTGISAAVHLRAPWVLFEREDRLGGHARTDERDGWRFDKTGHWLHLRDPGVKQLVEEVGSSRVDLQACKLEYSIVSPK